jgi:catechol 2,3-dioxygenase-like lactoylglutathione lyase family enzyme
MPPPRLRAIDHVHVFVSDRAAAATWYARVLGLKPKEDLAFWASDGGPLTLANDEDSIHIALFERPRLPCRSTVALRVSAADLRSWQLHLRESLGSEPRLEDHQRCWSLYFPDPDGNPYEITSYEYAEFAGMTAGSRFVTGTTVLPERVAAPGS